MSHPYHISRSDEGQEFITVFVAGVPLVADDTHPQFDRIEAIVRDGDATDEEVHAAFDLGEAISQGFKRLSERVTVANGNVYLDGDVMDNALTNLILRSLESTDPEADFRAFVAFLERVETNPSEHSREQLFAWLNARDFTITHEGYVVAYKGVQDRESTLDSPYRYESVTSGTTQVTVDDQTVTGRVPQDIGSVVEVPRSEVHEDPAVGCSYGLHVGTHEYATGWARGALLKVLVDPRDVVSVPTDCGAQKVRTCRYKVLDVIEAPETLPVVFDSWDDEDPDECCDPVCEVCVADSLVDAIDRASITAEDLRVLEDAIDGELPIDFYYTKVDDAYGDYTIREASPYGIEVRDNGNAYLMARDHGDDQLKQFALDGIEHVDAYRVDEVGEFRPATS